MRMPVFACPFSQREAFGLLNETAVIHAIGIHMVNVADGAHDTATAPLLINHHRYLTVNDGVRGVLDTVQTWCLDERVANIWSESEGLAD